MRTLEISRGLFLTPFKTAKQLIAFDYQAFVTATTLLGILPSPPHPRASLFGGAVRLNACE